MNYPLRLLVLTFGAAGMLACHARTQEIGFGQCDRNPPDTVPLPAISVRARADSPGVLVVLGHTDRGVVKWLNVILDVGSPNARGGPASYPEVLAGLHRLSVRSFGLGTRDTVITMPHDSGLVVDVPLSMGGGISRCEDYVAERTIPWWKFWDR